VECPLVALRGTPAGNHYKPHPQRSGFQMLLKLSRREVELRGTQGWD